MQPHNKVFNSCLLNASILYLLNDTKGLHQDTLDQRSMMHFVIKSSDIRLYVLHTLVKRGAELSIDHTLVVRWIHRQERQLERLGRLILLLYIIYCMVLL